MFAGLQRVAQRVERMSDAVMSERLAVAVAEPLENIQSMSVFGKCLGHAVHGTEGFAKAVVRVSLSRPIGELSTGFEGLLEIVEGLVVAAPTAVQQAKITEYIGLPSPIADFVLDGQGLLKMVEGPAEMTLL